MKQRKVEIDAFFIRRNISSIATYGFHFMGQRLYDELKDSAVKVMYAIDRKCNQQYLNLPIVHPDNSLEDVDAIVVTPIMDFLEIRDALSKIVNSDIISIEEVLFYDYEAF